MRSKVKKEPSKLVAEGILEPDEYSESNMTVNPLGKLDRYPIPKVDEDQFASLHKDSLS